MRSTALLIVALLLSHDTHNMFAQSRLFSGGAGNNPLKTAAGVIATMLFATMVFTGGMQKTQGPIAKRSGTTSQDPPPNTPNFNKKVQDFMNMTDNEVPTSKITMSTSTVRTPLISTAAFNKRVQGVLEMLDRVVP